MDDLHGGHLRDNHVDGEAREPWDEKTIDQTCRSSAVQRSESYPTRLAIDPIRSLLEGFLKQAGGRQLLAWPRNALDSRQSSLPRHKDGAAKADERNESETSLRDAVSQYWGFCQARSVCRMDALSEPAFCPAEQALVHLELDAGSRWCRSMG